MCAIIQVQHTLESETTDESITLTSHTGKCDDPQVLMLVLEYFTVKKKIELKIHNTCLNTR